MGSQPALPHKDVSKKNKETKQNENHIRKDNFIAGFLVSQKKRGKQPNVVRISATPLGGGVCLFHIGGKTGKERGKSPAVGMATGRQMHFSGGWRPPAICPTQRKSERLNRCGKIKLDSKQNQREGLWTLFRMLLFI